MSEVSDKPIIFISYSRKDEPEKPVGDDVRWLTFVMKFLYPGVKRGLYSVWTDCELETGAPLHEEIKDQLHACDLFVLLVSPNAMASDYVLDKELPVILERRAKGEDVPIYSLLLTPTPEMALADFTGLLMRPGPATPLSGFPRHDQEKHMADVADEIARILARRTAGRGGARAPRLATYAPPAFVHISGLPETGYEKLVGREAELGRLDAAWDDPRINILSLIAEGGAGKSALVNEWLKRMRAENYRGAASVLGWSFYSQGTKERATSADGFLDWAVDKLDAKPKANSGPAKGEAIAEAMMKRRVLLALDGVEPLQHGPDGQLGQLKDPGLRALLRRFAATPPAEPHGLIVLTSRLAVADIGRGRDGASPVVDVTKLSDEAGAALLRDNGIWGTSAQLKAAAHDFGGHPLALGLLASYLKETQNGDVRRRDHLRGLLAGAKHPGQDHARRVMESFVDEWLIEKPAKPRGFLASLFTRPPPPSDKPLLLAIMHIVGLFDRPASPECLLALRAEPVIAGLTEPIVGLGDDEWRRAVARLREARLLTPLDPNAPEALDAHPLVREWFGERLHQANEAAWKAAHGRLYEHLRDTTREGEAPTLADLTPLYQAIPHGCRAGRHQEALDDVYVKRICRRGADGQFEAYAFKKLGAVGSSLATISWFFVTPYATPVAVLSEADRALVLSEASFALRAQGRIAEALPAMRAALKIGLASSSWLNAAIGASNLSESELLVGEVAAAVADAQRSVDYADRSGDEFQIMSKRTTHADALHAAGRRDEAALLFADAEQRQQKRQPTNPLLYSLAGYRFCDLLLSTGVPAEARERASRSLELAKQNHWLLDIALDTLTLARANFALASTSAAGQLPSHAPADPRNLAAAFDRAVEALRAAGTNDHLPRGLLARAAYFRTIGDWPAAARDLDEVLEIAEPGPMRLFLCDRALERARVALARREAFAPLNGLVDDGPPRPSLPDAAEAARLTAEARADVDVAAKLIDECGYHRRDEELAELRDVLSGARKFADLPQRV